MVKDIFLSIKSIKGMKQLALIFCMLFIFNNYLMGQEQLTKNIPKDISDCLTKVGKDTLSTLREVLHSICPNASRLRDRKSVV